MKWILIAGGCMVLLFAPVVFANGWAPDASEIVARHRKAFEGKSPEYIAGYLVHPNGMVGSAARAALIEHGDAAIPLMKRAVGDTNPYVRRQAASILIQICREKMAKEAENPSESTKSLTALITSWSKHEDDAVRMAAVSFLSEAGAPTADYVKTLLELAKSSVASERAAAARAARERITDPATQIKILKEVYAGGQGLGNKDWSKMGIVMVKHIDHPLMREAIPALAKFLYEVCNGDPLMRGFFSNGAQGRALEVIVHHIDPELEKASPEIAMGLCRAHVRLPPGDFDMPYWGGCRKSTVEGLDKLTSASLLALERAIKIEEEALTKERQELDAVVDRMAEKAEKEKRKSLATREKYLAEVKAISDKLVVAP